MTTRANVEYNGMELVCAILMVHPEVSNFEELRETFVKMIKFPSEYSNIKFNNVTDDFDFRNYVNDINKKTKIINKYITNFNNSIKNNTSFDLTDVSCVFISGKTNKHSEIEELNKDICKLDAKSDIYIKFKNGSFIGISVKQSKDATKSNYSVHKFLGKETEKYLTELKLKYLTENGITEFNKENRKLINPLFYPNNKNNTYMNALREEINKNSSNIAQKLTSHLYCSNITYDVYEFDGTDLTKLNVTFDHSNVKFEEHLPYYFDKKGNERSAAKLFYKLTCNEKIYRVEIRWKGSITASPQFQIHEE
jgi:hypothetical protein